MCPYVRNSFTRLTIIKYDDKESEPIEKGSLIIENYTNPECKREKCGVWHDGKYCFNQ